MTNVTNGIIVTIFTNLTNGIIVTNVWQCISTGAPAIGITAAYGLAIAQVFLTISLVDDLDNDILLLRSITIKSVFSPFLETWRGFVEGKKSSGDNSAHGC